jgi:hypothetical protein
MLVSLVCAAGHAVALLTHRFLMPPPALKEPERVAVYGRLTYLTVQSNMICCAFHALRCWKPASAIATQLHPLAFALGFALSILYYALDHFQPKKQELDKKWIKKGFTWVPVGNHLEHALALPLAILDSVLLPRGVPSAADVLIFAGGYGFLYFVGVCLLGKKLSGYFPVRQLLASPRDLTCSADPQRVASTNAPASTVSRIR